MSFARVEGKRKDGTETNLAKPRPQEGHLNGLSSACDRRWPERLWDLRARKARSSRVSFDSAFPSLPRVRLTS